jgi:hypothetical protein
MDEASGSPTAHKAKNGKFKFTPEIESKILDACGSGFTIEKAGALVGVNPSTIRTWIQRMPKFSEKVETARKNHELSLLKSIELAGEKSWQAKAWLAERIYHHAIPSSRLTVDTSVTHNASAGFAQLLAGLASRRAEKKAQVIECQDVKALEQPQSKYNTYCATDGTQSIVTPIPLENEKVPGKARHVRMKRRKPRQNPMDTTTPPATPPAPV